MIVHCSLFQELCVIAKFVVGDGRLAPFHFGLLICLNYVTLLSGKTFGTS